MINKVKGDYTIHTQDDEVFAISDVTLVRKVRAEDGFLMWQVKVGDDEVIFPWNSVYVQFILSEKFGLPGQHAKIGDDDIKFNNTENVFVSPLPNDSVENQAVEFLSNYLVNDKMIVFKADHDKDNVPHLFCLSHWGCKPEFGNDIVDELEDIAFFEEMSKKVDIDIKPVIGVRAKSCILSIRYDDKSKKWDLCYPSSVVCSVDNLSELGWRIQCTVENFYREVIPS